MELQHAYPEGLLEQFVRKFHFDLETGELRVEDFFRFPQKEGRVRESLITRIRPVVTEEGILLKKDGVSALLTFSEPVMPPIHIEEYEHQNHRGRPETVYAIQWQLTASEGTTAAGFSVCCKEDVWN